MKIFEHFTCKKPNVNGIPDEWDQFNSDTNDCNNNRISDSCEILFGDAADVNGNSIPATCVNKPSGVLHCPKLLRPQATHRYAFTYSIIDIPSRLQSQPNDSQTHANAQNSSITKKLHGNTRSMKADLNPILGSEDHPPLLYIT